MALPKEPRQKMINLMYLVLTALLALNVSAEILNAFKTVDNSLDRTNKTINASTEEVMTSFQEMLADEKTKVKAAEWYPKAQQAQQLSAELYNYIESLRGRLLSKAGFDPAKKKDSTFKEDNQDIPTRMMISEKTGDTLRQKLADYRKAMLAIDPKVAEEFSRSLQIDTEVPITQNKNNKTWADAYFHMVPTVAALTMLRKFQNDVKTSENKVVTFLHQQVGKVVIRYDNFEAIVGQNSKYLMPGQKLEITAGLGAFSKQKLPTVTIGGATVGLNDKGMAIKELDAGGLGTHTIPVTVSFVDQDGVNQTRTIPVEYTVGAATASIALDKMNVLYIGVDNPVTISASAGGDDKTSVSISNGSITKVGAGKYIARVNTVSDNTIITVSVDGKVAGASPFRVRSIPTPQAYIGGMPSGTGTSAAALANQAGIGAGIKDFPFELTYNVVEYTVVGLDENGDVIKASGNGAAFTPQARKLIGMAKPGDIISITNLYAVGPDGVRKKLPALLYNIN